MYGFLLKGPFILLLLYKGPILEYDTSSTSVHTFLATSQFSIWLSCQLYWTSMVGLLWCHTLSILVVMDLKVVQGLLLYNQTMLKPFQNCHPKTSLQNSWISTETEVHTDRLFDHQATSGDNYCTAF